MGIGKNEKSLPLCHVTPGLLFCFKASRAIYRRRRALKSVFNGGNGKNRAENLKNGLKSGKLLAPNGKLLRGNGKLLAESGKLF